MSQTHFTPRNIRTNLRSSQDFLNRPVRKPFIDGLLRTVVTFHSI